MAFVSLAKFQKTTQISDAALVWLLTHQKLQCQCSSSGEIQVDTDSVTMKALIAGLSRNDAGSEPTLSPVLEEKITQMLANYFDEIVETALKNAAS